MKRLVCAGFAALFLLTMGSGCALWGAEGAYWDRVFHKAMWQDTNSTQSAADRMHTQRQVVDQDARSLVDDFDWMTMRERPSRLSRWHNR